ncbi:hypothetical protein CEP54_008333 [Fusarium duplospermum]|uniref:DUF1479 domain protein n=1 Tax=Fusarium duplospermum TaxID=1325734 RepID=A0A428PWK8_9HYPO|nr:hypothetical protein CEP54_008333 [Fusarium duplospermum]
MATPSVDLPPPSDDEVAVPMLDHAPGLASAIGVAAVAAVAGHQVLGGGLPRSIDEDLCHKSCDANDSDGRGKEEDGKGRQHDEEKKRRRKKKRNIREENQQKGLREAQEKWDAATAMVAVRTEAGAEAIPGSVASRGEGGAALGLEVGAGVGAGEPEGVLPSPRKGTDLAGQQVRAALSRSRLGRSTPSSPSLGSLSVTGTSSYHLTNTNTNNLSNYTQGGRITKPRHRASLSASIAASLTSAVAAAETVKFTYGAKVAATLAATTATMVGNLASTTTTATASPKLKHNGLPTLQTTSKTTASTPTVTTTNSTARESPVLSFWGPEPIALPSRFARIKRNLIRGHEAELEASWTRLITALRDEVSRIEDLGAHLIPSIEFSDIDDEAQTARFGHDLKRYGVGVIRKVVPRADTDTAVRETVDYLDSKRHIKALQHDPACFDFFWTPAQVRSRAHPNVLSAQRFMMGLWETGPDDQLVTRLPITYVDRIRVHGNTENQSNGLNVPPLEPPQSADDWIQALQSSAGIIAQVDNGSLERWEPDGYQHAGTYNHIFHGRWEDHDPWECTSRTSVTTDLYNGYGACTIFRMFQGILALSTVEPGMVRLLPSPKLATAYYLLRPFFTTKNPPPETRSGPEWDAYLAPENWQLQQDPDSIIHGAVPGHAQRITEIWHPHLHLRSSMITLPTLQPGDYILWHPDLPYYLSSNNYGLKTPSGSNSEVSMLVYMPAAPLTQTNALYLARQRKAFQRGHPGPDFDSTGRGIVEEDSDTRPGEKEIADVGGPAALQAMGLAPWEVAGTRSGSPPSDKAKSKDEDDVDMEAETRSLMSSSSVSRAEAEVVRLANIILFPDRSMMGYSV